MAKLQTFWNYISSNVGKIKFKLLFQGPLAKWDLKKTHNNTAALNMRKFHWPVQHQSRFPPEQKPNGKGFWDPESPGGSRAFWDGCFFIPWFDSFEDDHVTEEAEEVPGYGCFLKWWYPQIIHFDRVFQYKPSILGYPYFWKHPYVSAFSRGWGVFFFVRGCWGL